MDVDIATQVKEMMERVTLWAKKFPKKGHKLGSIFHKEGDVKNDVRNRIGAG